IQKAGHMPWLQDIFIRDSKYPYVWLNLPDVFIRAEVYWQVPYQQPLPDCRFAVITRLPWPSMAALFVPLVYHWYSWLFPLLLPVSMFHLPPSTPLPAGPLNSSAKVVTAAAALVLAGPADAGWAMAAADTRAPSKRAALSAALARGRPGRIDIIVTSRAGG